MRIGTVGISRRIFHLSQNQCQLDDEMGDGNVIFTISILSSTFLSCNYQVFRLMISLGVIAHAFGGVKKCTASTNIENERLKLLEVERFVHLR